MIKRKNVEWYLALFALVTILLAWSLGRKSSKDETMSQLRRYFPETHYQIERVDEAVWELTGENQNFMLARGTGKGYAAPITVLVQYNNDKYEIERVKILSSHETPSYFLKVLRRNYLNQFVHKKWDSFFARNKQADVISGATKTCEGILNGIQSASLKLAQAREIEPLPETKKTALQLGFKEMFVVLLFLFGFLSRLRNFRYRKYIRWIALLLGLVFLGFVFNEPITLTRINSFLIGFWPDWHTELYIYLLFGGILLILITSGKNVYCHTICPFGALQEITGEIGKAKNVKLKYRYFWTWLQRSLAWIAVFLALLFRNPGVSEYEVFGAAFQLTGSVWLFILLGIILIASFLIRKPWCNYFCPVSPIIGFFQIFRNKIKLLWGRG